MKTGGNFTFPIVDYGVTLTEIPDHIAVFFEFGNCKLRCYGCHSENLWDPVENQMNCEEVLRISNEYLQLGANAVVLMGGTTNGIPMSDLKRLLVRLRNSIGNRVGLFSGLDHISDHKEIIDYLKWLKVGHYDSFQGGLNNPLTNQRFYEIINGEVIDKTSVFRRDASV